MKELYLSLASSAILVSKWRIYYLNQQLFVKDLWSINIFKRNFDDIHKICLNLMSSLLFMIKVSHYYCLFHLFIISKLVTLSYWFILFIDVFESENLYKLYLFFFLWTAILLDVYTSRRFLEIPILFLNIFWFVYYRFYIFINQKNKLNNLTIFMF